MAADDTIPEGYERVTPGSTPAVPEGFELVKPARSNVPKIGDLGIGVAQSATNLAGAVAQIPNLATGGAVDDFVVRPAQRALDRALGGPGSDYGIAGGIAAGNEAFDAAKSDNLRQQQQELAETEGVLPTLQKVATNPVLLAQFAAEQVPIIATLGAGAVGTAARAASLPAAAGLSPTLVAAAGRKAAERSLIGASGALGGGYAGNTAVTDSMSQPEEVWQQNPDYVALAAQIGPEAAKQRLSLRAGQIAGAVAAPLSAAAGRLTAPLEAAVFTRTPGVAIGSAVAREAGEEFVQEGSEQFAQNLGVQQTADPSRELGKGVAEAATIGGTLGAVMGGGLAVANKLTAKPQIPVVGPLSAAAQLVTPAATPPAAITHQPAPTQEPAVVGEQAAQQARDTAQQEADTFYAEREQETQARELERASAGMQVTEAVAPKPIVTSSTEPAPIAEVPTAGIEVQELTPEPAPEITAPRVTEAITALPGDVAVSSEGVATPQTPEQAEALREPRAAAAATADALSGRPTGFPAQGPEQVMAADGKPFPSLPQANRALKLREDKTGWEVNQLGPKAFVLQRKPTAAPAAPTPIPVSRAQQAPVAAPAAPVQTDANASAPATVAAPTDPLVRSAGAPVGQRTDRLNAAVQESLVKQREAAQRAGQPIPAELQQDVDLDAFSDAPTPAALKPLVNGVKKLFGRDVVFFTAKPGAAHTSFDGTIDKDGTIYVRRDAQRPHRTVVFHELFHTMARSDKDLYRALREVAEPMLRNRKQYQRVSGVERKSSGYVTEEMLADLFAHEADRTEFWDELANTMPRSQFRQMVRKVLAALTKLKNTVLGMQEDRINPNDFVRDIDEMAALLRSYTGQYLDRMQAGDVESDLDPAAADGSPESRRTAIQPEDSYREATPEERKALKIPPAFTGAMINTNPNANIRGYAINAKGKRVPVYTDSFSQGSLNEKFERQRRFNDALPSMLENINRDAPTNEAAAALQLIVHTGFRIGSPKILGNAEAFGATNLRAEHVKIQGDYITFDFPGKKQVRQFHTINNPELAKSLAPRVAKGGRLFNISADQVRAYLYKQGGDYKVHDFRTWNATDAARAAIRSMGTPTTTEGFWAARDAVGEIAAAKIGDTVKVALDVYVDPEVFSAWRISANVSATDTRPRRVKRAKDVPATAEGDGGVLRDSPKARRARKSAEPDSAADEQPFSRRRELIEDERWLDDIERGTAFEESLFGVGEMSDAFYRHLKPTAPRRRLIDNNRASYNELREEMGLPPITEWRVPPRSPIASLSASDTPETVSRRNAKPERYAYATDGMRLLAQIGNFTQNPISKAKELKDILAGVDPDIGVIEREEQFLDRSEEHGFFDTDLVRQWNIRMADGKVASLVQTEDGRLSLNASKLKSGKSRGSALYQAIADYAFNNNLVFIGDPMGLSLPAQYRRTEQMLASALKHGTTRHIAPHEYQVNPLNKDEWGVEYLEPLFWGNDDLKNMEHLLRTAHRNILNVLPEMADTQYNFKEQRFEFFDPEDGAWHPLGQDRLSDIAESDAGRQANAGRNTLARTALINSFLRAESPAEWNAILARLSEQRGAGEVDEDLEGLSYSRRTPGNTPGSVFRKLVSIITGRPTPRAAAAANAAGANPASWDIPEDTAFDDFVYYIQNKFIDTKRTLQAIRAFGNRVGDDTDVELKETLYSGRAAKATQDFIHMELDPLLKQMVADGVTKEQLEEFLHARHAPEANRVIAQRNPQLPDGGSGMKTADAQAYMAALPAAEKAKLTALADKVDEIIKGTRNDIVNYGLESAGTVNAWTSAYQHYVPLFREDKEGGQPGVGQGFSVRGPASKMRTGSERRVVDILANIVMARERAITRGEKNRVANALLALVEQNPNKDFWRVDNPPMVPYVAANGLVQQRVEPNYKMKPNVVMARTLDARGDVVERAIIFNDTDPRALRMAEALKNLDADDLGAVLGMSAKITRYFAAINTQYNPIFGVVNLLRDTQGALFNLSTTPLRGKQAAVAKNVLAALKGVYLDSRAVRKGAQPSSGWAQEWEEFQTVGGQTGFRDMFRTAGERAEAIEDEINKIKQGKVRKAGTAILDWLSDYNTAMENAVRLSAYKEAKAMGLTPERAAVIAKNLTVNFNRKGQIATQAGALYAFFNASAQGTTRLLETLGGPSGRKILLGAATLGVMQALALAAAGFDPEEPPEFVRERNIIIPIGDKKYITIPMPLGLHVFPHTTRVLTEYALDGFTDAPKRISQLVGAYFDAFNPMGNAGLSLQTFAPTAADPFVALAENRDFTGRAIYQEDFNPNRPTPGMDRAKDTATEFSKALSKVINYTSGGTDYTPGLFSPTPDQLDYLVGQLTGGLGREYSKLEQTITSTASGESLPPYKVPLLGRFFGIGEGQAAEGAAFYTNLRRINLHRAEIEGRQENREPLGNYRSEHPESQLINLARTSETQVRNLRRRKRELVDKGGSKVQVAQLEKQITVTMKRLNDRVRALRDSS